MKILVVSDTHGRNGNLMRVIQKEKNIDLMIHLGDLCGLEDYLEETTGIPCYMVRGNNDYSSMLPAESIIMVGKHRTLITHGHYLGVYGGTSQLRRYAGGLDCDIVMYGHTHCPEIDCEGGITVVNPGSLTLPRQPGHKPSYIIAVTDDDGEVVFKDYYLD